VYGVRHEQARKLSILLGSMYVSNGLYHIKNDEAIAKTFFRKAIMLHHDALKTLVDVDGAENSDDEDLESNIGSVNTAATTGKDGIICSLPTSVAAVERAAEIAAIKMHVRLLKLAYQRHGGWPKQAVDYERLTSKVWAEFGSELGFKEEQVVSSKWTPNGFGGGKAESNMDDWKIPAEWSIFEEN